MNKQAQVFDVARKTIFWMIAGFIITVVVLVFAYTLATYQSKLTHVPLPLRAELIALRFTESCFAYVGETGGVHSGIIDASKFTNETLATCYKTADKEGFQDYNFRLTLLPSGREIITNNYFHHDDYVFSQAVTLKTPSGEQQEEMIMAAQEKI